MIGAVIEKSRLATDESSYTSSMQFGLVQVIVHIHYPLYLFHFFFHRYYNNLLFALDSIDVDEYQVF